MQEIENTVPRAFEGSPEPVYLPGLSQHPDAVGSRLWRAAVRTKLAAARRPEWKPITFRTKTSKHCHFIPGLPKGPDTVYCGKQVKPGSPYCDEHDVLCRPPRLQK